MQQELKLKLQELLATKNQITGRLVKVRANEPCFCMEGIIALGLEGKLELTKNGSIKEAIWIDETPFTHIISEFLYANYMPVSVSIELILKHEALLQLTVNQIKILNGLTNVKSRCSWPQLNDTVQLTFPQFSKLLDLI